MGPMEKPKTEIRQGDTSPSVVTVVARAPDIDDRCAPVADAPNAKALPPLGESDSIRYKRAVNARAPFNKLPVELVVIIFGLSVSLYSMNERKRFYRLARVSSRWWDIVRQTPQFWTSVRLHTPKIAAICVQRSSPLPIEIYWPFYYNKPRKPSENTLAALHNIVQGRLHARIGLLMLSTLYAEHWLPILVESLPSLKFLFVEHKSRVSAPFEWPAAALELCTQLEVLKLFNVTFPPTRGFFRTLTELVIGCMDNEMSNESFLAILPQLQRLRSLHLLFQTVEGLRSSDALREEGGLVVLPGLKSLELRSTSPSATRFILNCLLTPALDLLSINWLYCGPGGVAEEDAIATVMDSVFRPRDATDSPAAAALRNTPVSRMEVVLTWNKIQVNSTDPDRIESGGLRFTLDKGGEWPFDGTHIPDIEFTLFKDVSVTVRLDCLNHDNSPQTTDDVDSRILWLVPTTTVLEYVGVAGEALEGAIRFLIPEDEDDTQVCPALQKISIFRAVEELNGQEEVIDAIGDLLESRRAYNEGTGTGLTVWSRGRSPFDEDENEFVGAAGEDLPCPCEVPDRRLPRIDDW